MGSAITRGLAESGATVVIASRDESKCESAASRWREEGLAVEAARCDLGVESDIRALCELILSRHGRIDVLVNNSLHRAGGDLRHTTAEEWDAAMRVNSTGLFLACRIFSEPMQAQRSGSIVNIGSIYGVVAPDFALYEGMKPGYRAEYSFAKAGMIGFTRYVAAYLAPYQVRANCIILGGVENDTLPPDFVERFAQRTLAGRMAGPDDIQGPAVFLASEASRYITGDSISVDGGWTVR